MRMFSTITFMKALFIYVFILDARDHIHICSLDSIFSYLVLVVSLIHICMCALSASPKIHICVLITFIESLFVYVFILGTRDLIYICSLDSIHVLVEVSSIYLCVFCWLYRKFMYYYPVDHIHGISLRTYIHARFRRSYSYSLNSIHVKSSLILIGVSFIYAHLFCWFYRKHDDMSCCPHLWNAYSHTYNVFNSCYLVHIFNILLMTLLLHMFLPTSLDAFFRLDVLVFLSANTSGKPFCLYCLIDELPHSICSYLLYLHMILIMSYF